PSGSRSTGRWSPALAPSEARLGKAPATPTSPHLRRSRSQASPTLVPTPAPSPARTTAEPPRLSFAQQRRCVWGILGGVTLMGAAALLDLVGRDPELQAIDTAIAALGEGRGGALALVGPGGVGKSRLAREAIARASA